ncbi:Cytochrome P450 [Venustampulla echinocandica]|uniref:Cytochrome P450 n=1 Tax=Venustampulla echinocandica TaxID=2656787 RepID=A0A370TBM4_9HELO|nr:Cytochrome P450 [Venustampulla echinocandica]RDL31454.1 Cytochrome P450 [Venustampulla echinocandica]
MTFVHIVGAIVIALLAWPFVKIVNHHGKARKIGLPIVISSIDLYNPFWATIGPYIFPLIARLPYGLGDAANCDTYKWNMKTRSRLHRQLGPAFIIVDPRGIKIMLADGHAIEDVLVRRKEFPKPDVYKILDVFGPNVDSVNGDKWQRHRKITAPPFNERNSKLVWKESLSQATGMLQAWANAGKAGINNTRTDTMTLALHVLTGAGFGKFFDFQGGVSKPGPGHKMSFEESLHIVLNKFIAVLVAASITFIPKRFSSVQTATVEFKQYLTEMVAEERASMDLKSDEKDNLMSALLRASDLRDSQGDGKNTLSNDEIYGNLFIYTFAGHDTTANTIAYAVYLLSTDNDIQSWLKEEIQAVIGVYGDVENWNYEEVFPRLKRCLALMFETVRVFGPVVMLPRETNDSYQPLAIKGKTYMIPPSTSIIISMLGPHTSPESWGFDSYVWRPDRFIIKEGNSTDLEHEQLLQAAASAFVPWSWGPRICPGKKFAQVEFVAVIARLFQHHRVKPVLQVGESPEQASRRIHEIIEDSAVGLTLCMKHPERVKLMWEKDT